MGLGGWESGASSNAYHKVMVCLDDNTGNDKMTASDVFPGQSSLSRKGIRASEVMGRVGSNERAASDSNLISSLPRVPRKILLHRREVCLQRNPSADMPFLNLHICTQAHQHPRQGGEGGEGKKSSTNHASARAGFQEQHAKTVGPAR